MIAGSLCRCVGGRWVGGMVGKWSVVGWLVVGGLAVGEFDKTKKWLVYSF